jgi:aldehyde dehydrogenase (NAD+)
MPSPGRGIAHLDRRAAGAPAGQPLYVAGEWRPSAATATIEVVNPATEDIAARVPEGLPADVDDAVAAARGALAGWAAVSAGDRTQYLRRLRRELLAMREACARAITTEMGAPISFARRVQTGLALRALGSFLDALPEVVAPERLGHSVVVREPVGVVAAITPWNYPLNQALVKVAAALAVGCTVVLKPSEQAPLSAALLAEAIHGIGLPPGVFNMVHGRGSVVGAALAAHPDVDMVSFTGSTDVGRRVAELAAATVKKISLELGGKSATVILPDADLEAAVRDGVTGCLLNSGQTCTALTRMLVRRESYAEALRMAARVMAGYQIGDPGDPRTQLGPLVSEAARQRVRGCLARAAEAGIEQFDGSGGQPLPERGFYAAPVVLGVTDPGAEVAQREIFGPVLCVIPYADEDEALTIANDSPFGLAGSVWSADVDHAVAFAGQLRTGRVDINGAKLNPAAPFGGRRGSGFGYEMGRFGMAEFQVLKAIQLPGSPDPDNENGAS